MEILDMVKEQFGQNNANEKENVDLPWETQIAEKQQNKKLNTKGIATIGICILILIIMGVWLFNYFNHSQNISIDKTENTEQTSEKQIKQIQVHVSGAVAKPGVYKLDEGSRVMDAVNAAGGFTSDAVQDSLNLAKVIEDGEQIVIAVVVTNTNIGNTASNNNSSSSTTNTNTNGKVNINTADLSQLQTLNGVGPSTAQKIIDYRNANGKFKSIEELKNVSGIGDKTFAKFADKICV